MTNTELLDTEKLFRGEQTLDLEPTSGDESDIVATLKTDAPEVEIITEEAPLPLLAPGEENDPEKRKVVGDEARKRIDKLTREKRELQRQLQENQAAEAKLRKERDQFYHEKQVADYSSAKNFNNQLQSELAQLKAELVKANETMDFSKQVEIQQKMMDATIKLNATNQYLTTRKPPEQAAPREAAPQYAPQAPQAQGTVPKTVERRAQKWLQENATWFDTRLAQEVNSGQRALRTAEEEDAYAMTVAAEGIAASLLRQGFDVSNEDDDEYGTEAFFAEVNKRIRRQFPHKFQAAARPTIPVAPKSNPAPQSSANKSVVRYDQSTADLLTGIAQYGGVSIQDIAKQTQKRLATEGTK